MSFYILTASSDTYITDKIISNKFRATDANVGRAGTLDLFRLYNESSITVAGTRLTSSVEELSRILVKFDYENVEPLLKKNLDINSNSFKAELQLFEVPTGTPVPRDFHIVCYPLAVGFDEGAGSSVSGFSDVGVANYITASYTGGSNVTWNISGSGKPGVLDEANVDYYTSGTIGGSLIDFGASKHFDEGPGDLFLDVTKVVSSSLAGNLTNKGFRIAFSGSDETDEKTRFVKRFLSKQSKNQYLKPRILLTWDDSIRDRHLDLQFNVPSTLFLKNFESGKPANLISDNSLTEVVGPDSLTLRFVSGSGTNNETTFTVQASQHTGSTTGAGMTGVYSASFNLKEFNTTFFGDTPKSRGEVELQEIWSTNDLSVGFYTGSVKITKPLRSISGFANRRLHVTAVGARPEYKTGSELVIRLFIEDLDVASTDQAYKLPRSKKSLVLDSGYYRVVDSESGKIVVPFDKTRNSTRLSTDAAGMYVSFLTAGLPKGRTYHIDLLLNDMGIERLIKLEGVSFRIV